MILNTLQRSEIVSEKLCDKKLTGFSSESKFATSSNASALWYCWRLLYHWIMFYIENIEVKNVDFTYYCTNRYFTFFIKKFHCRDSFLSFIFEVYIFKRTAKADLHSILIQKTPKEVYRAINKWCHPCFEILVPSPPCHTFY